MKIPFLTSIIQIEFKRIIHLSDAIQEMRQLANKKRTGTVQPLLISSRPQHETNNNRRH